MAITIEFNEAITAKDIRMIRIMLKDSLVVDPTLAEFNTMTTIAEANFDELYDDHDGEKLNFDISVWDKNYMDKQMVQVVYNFSKERLELLKSICQFLYKSRAKKIESDREKSSESNNLTQKQIGTGVVLTGVAVAAVGIVVSKSVVIGVGGIAIIVGGILIISGE